MAHSEDDYGPWHPHDGKGMPRALLGLQMLVELEGPDGRTAILEMIGEAEPAGCDPWHWSCFGRVCVCQRAIVPKVLRYRIRESRAMRDLRAQLDVPEDAPVVEVLDA